MVVMVSCRVAFGVQDLVLEEVESETPCRKDSSRVAGGLCSRCSRMTSIGRPGSR